MQCARCKRSPDVVRLKVQVLSLKVQVKLKVLKTCARCLEQTCKYMATKANKAAIAKYKAEWAASHKDKIAQQKAEYYVANRDAVLEYQTRYRAANKDVITKRQIAYNAAKYGTDVQYRIKHIQKGANERGYKYALTEEQAEALLRGVCEYCGHKNDDSFNGIDRMDNSQGYVAGNCVSACSTCNYLKGTEDAGEFRRRCAHISGFAACLEAFPDCPHGGRYAATARSAARRNLPFELSKEDFRALTKRDCEYCGKPTTATHTNGVDRVNNDKGYVAENCVAACGTCNFMKRTQTVDEFRMACERVAVYM